MPPDDFFILLILITLFLFFISLLLAGLVIFLFDFLLPFGLFVVVLLLILRLRARYQQSQRTYHGFQEDRRNSLNHRQRRVSFVLGWGCTASGLCGARIKAKHANHTREGKQNGNIGWD